MSQLRHVELADECESIKTNTNYVLAGFMTHWRAGSRACSRLNFCEFVFFSLKKLSQLRGAEPATRRWASYVALSQLRGTEPATWHWASKVALSFELARRQWASKVALSFIIYIYIPMQSQAYNILNLGQNNFFEGDTSLWAGAGMWNLPFDQMCVCRYIYIHTYTLYDPVSRPPTPRDTPLLWTLLFGLSTHAMHILTLYSLPIAYLRHICNLHLALTQPADCPLQQFHTILVLTISILSFTLTVTVFYCLLLPICHIFIPAPYILSYTILCLYTVIYTIYILFVCYLCAIYAPVTYNIYIYIYILYIYIYIYTVCICIYIYTLTIYIISICIIYILPIDAHTYLYPPLTIYISTYIITNPHPPAGGEGDHMYSHTPLLTYMYIQHCLVLMPHTSNLILHGETRWKQMFVGLSTMYNSLVGNGVLFVWKLVVNDMPSSNQTWQWKITNS